MKKRLVAALFVVALMVSLMMPAAYAKSSKDQMTLLPDPNNQYVSTYKDLNALGMGKIVVYPKDLETSASKYPVVVWANGSYCPTQTYYAYIEGLAKAGYVVISDTDILAGEGDTVIDSVDYIIAANDDPTSIFYGKIDVDKIGAAGHSLGGQGVVNAAGADSRIKSIISLAGNSTTSQAKKVTCPAFYIGGATDVNVSLLLYVKPSYKSSAGPAVYGTLRACGHFAVWYTPCRYIDYSVSWFDATLNGNADSLAVFLKGGALSKDKTWTSVMYKGF